MLVIKQFGPVTYAMGTLQEILAGTGIAAKVRALPNDVAGCTLEMDAGGLWTGNLGTLTKAQADALVAAGVMETVKAGAKSTVSTSDYSWNGVGWVAAYGGAVGTLYNGTTVPLPTPSAALLGMRIPVVNPAVPRGFSWLECNGTAWVPPYGELIMSAWGTNITPLADVTPGVLAQTVIWSSPTIPDYMLLRGFKAEMRVQAAAYNASGVANCIMGAALAGGIPTFSLSTQSYNYPASISVTPNVSGVGFDAKSALFQIGRSINGDSISHSSGGSGKFLRNSVTPGFVSGNMKAYLVAFPSHVADRIVLDGISITSLGAL